MHGDNTATDWKRFKDHAKVKWGKLTTEQLDATGGIRDALRATIQQAYALSRAHAEGQIKAFERTYDESWATAKWPERGPPPDMAAGALRSSDAT